MTGRHPHDIPIDDPAEVARLAATLARPVLVGCDVDGTLAAIAPTPAAARLEGGALAALERLVTLGVDVAVVSGRSLFDLHHQFGLSGDSLVLVGSHGVEMDGEPPLSANERATLAAATAELERICSRVPGGLVEHKSCGVALHVRSSDPHTAAWALAAVRQSFAASRGVTLLEGHAVIEVAVRAGSKGDAVARLRARHAPSSVLFVGDDVSDESVFGTLGPLDLAVRVGPGPTLANRRLSRPADVVRMLGELAARWE